MNKLKIITLLCLVGVLLIGATSMMAYASTIFSQAGSNPYVLISAVHPSSGSGYSALGCSFKPTTAGWLTVASVYLTTVDYETYTGVTFYASIYNATGNVGVDAVPAAGDAIRNSSEVTLTKTNAGWNDFTFAAGDVHINPALNYTLVIFAKNGSFVGSGGYTKAYEFSQSATSTSTYSGANFNAGSFSYSQYALGVQIFGSDTPLTTPLPTAPAATATPDNYTWDLFASIIPPLALFLIPAILLGYIGKWNLWLIMVGLTIGAGLCVLFLGAAYTWLVVAIIIGIVALAWKGSP